MSRRYKYGLASLSRHKQQSMKARGLLWTSSGPPPSTTSVREVINKQSKMVDVNAGFEFSTHKGFLNEEQRRGSIKDEAKEIVEKVKDVYHHVVADMRGEEIPLPAGSPPKPDPMESFTAEKTYECYERVEGGVIAD